jgi:O-antigen/teichoic acid export membrane protein
MGGGLWLHGGRTRFAAGSSQSQNAAPNAAPSAAVSAASGAVSPGGTSTERLSKPASLNAVAGGLDFGVRTIVELVLNPLLLSGLGDVLYGTWRLLWRLTGYLWATSGRGAQALQAALAHRLHSDDVDEKRRLVGASIVVWALYLPLLGVVTAFAVWLLPGMLDTPADDVGLVRWAILLLGVDAIAVSLLTIPQSTLQGSNQGYKRMGLSTALVALSGLLTASVLWLGMGIVGVAVANLISTLIVGAAFWRITKKHVPWFGVAAPLRNEMRWFFGLSSWFVVWKFVNQLMLSGDVLVLGIVGSVELVTVYSLTKFIPEAVLPLLAMLVMGGIPGLGGIIGARDHERARRVRSEVIAFTWLLAIAASVAIIVWNESFVALWVGPEYFTGDTELLLMMITGLQLALIRSDALIIDVTLRVRTKTLTGLASSLIALATAAVLIGLFDMGITGLCIGLILGRLLLTFVYPAVAGDAIGHPLSRQLRAVLRPGLTTLVLFAGAAAGQRAVAVDSWIVVGVGSILTFVAALGLAFGVGLHTSFRRQLAVRVRSLARGVRR